MDNEPQVTREQMEQTRTALQDKLEALEQQVTQTVQGAADAATETVQTVKEAVQETVATVKDSVEETVDTAKRSLDLTQHVREHPWTMFLAATAVGFIATRSLAGRRMPESGATMPVAGGSVSATPALGRPNGRHGLFSSEKPTRQPQAVAEEAPGVLTRIADHYGDELAKVQSLAVGTVGAVVRDMLISHTPPAMAEQIKEIVNGFTEKLGGKPISLS
jgi:ElaB/YqjD/DUF883 family membrane-anchored ribosome-binding protein